MSLTGCPPASQKGKEAAQGVAHAISGYQDPNMSWEDVTWIKSITKLPVIVKGIRPSLFLFRALFLTRACI